MLRLSVILFLFSTLCFAMDDYQLDVRRIAGELGSHNSKSQVLLVIDMQEAFPAAQDVGFQSRIADEIKRAMERNELIVFVEFRDWGPTYAALTELTRDYVKRITIRKENQSACEEVEKLLNDLATTNHTLRVCGIDTAACVQSTAL